MHSFYINEKGQIFKVIKSGVNYQLNDIEKASFMAKVLEADIMDVRYDNKMVTLIYDKDTITIDNLYLKEDNTFVKGINAKLLEAKAKREKQNIDEVKKRFKGYIPPINRDKCKRFGALLVASSLVLSLVVPSVLALGYRKNKNKNNNLNNSITYLNFEDLPTPIVTFKPDEISPTLAPKDDTIYVELAFEDWTRKAINRDGESQVEVVTRNCASYLEPYIDRYGLPSNVTYAICTIEKGILDSHLSNDNVSNPMRINSSMSGEYFKVPVYENGVLTGEYDTFYAFSKDDPRIADHPDDKILIIENLEDNFQIGCALFRRCIDKYKNIFIAIDAYNKGLYAFSILYNQDLIEIPKSREYYQDNFNDFSWTSFIPEYYKAKTNNPDYVYGDPVYIWDVLKHVDMGNESSVMISYYYNGELMEVNLTNTNKLDNSLDNDYNNPLGRG